MTEDICLKIIADNLCIISMCDYNIIYKVVILIQDYLPFDHIVSFIVLSLSQ